MAVNADIFPTLPVLLADVTKLINAYSAVLGKEEYAGKTGDIRAARRAVEVAK